MANNITCMGDLLFDTSRERLLQLGSRNNEVGVGKIVRVNHTYNEQLYY